MNFWRKLNHLIPEPQCSTKGTKQLVDPEAHEAAVLELGEDAPAPDVNDGLITKWHDVRPQPTRREIFEVDMADVEATELAHQENNFEIKNAIKQLAKAAFIHENKFRAIEGKAPITFRQFVKGVNKL
jgi:hypothetical protein